MLEWIFSPLFQYSSTMKFYEDIQVEQLSLENLCNLNSELLESAVPRYLVLRKADLMQNECLEKLEAFNFHPIMESVPPWIQKLNDLYAGVDLEQVLVLYKQE